MDAWRTRLEERDAVVAWDLFLERYRKLIVATIRRLVPDSDDVMDVFVLVCEALRADDLARLRRFTEAAEQRASFSTWLVTVVRNLTIDWLRHRDGRARPSSHVVLPPMQSRILDLLARGCSHVEAFETIRSRDEAPLSFAAYLHELNEVYRAIGGAPLAAARHHVPSGMPQELPGASEEPYTATDAPERMARALATLPPADRLAVQLFVIDGLRAADVARTVGWANSKTVYNRVYRALRLMRTLFERQGIGRDDL
jgi:RNA polymerase sigma factor (sigma-70 family)